MKTELFVAVSNIIKSECRKWNERGSEMSAKRKKKESGVERKRKLAKEGETSGVSVSQNSLLKIG